MRNRLSLIPLLLTFFAVALGAPATAGAVDRAILTDCNDGTLDGSYSVKQLQSAVQELQANTSEYSECSDAIQQALQDKLTKSTSGGGGSTGSTGGSGGGGSSTGGGAATPTGQGAATTTPSGAGTTTQTTTTPDPQTDARGADPAERAAALAQATAAADKKAGDTAAKLQDTGVPAAAVELGASTDTTLPTPLLLTLVACVVAACIAGGATGLQALRRRRGR
ncbi:hypothetical protein AB0L40_05600 [Patulibacter sp. NPDC049589]|uniref:hypothetical protein n=1 Tax=Patulibacter sp. NPDC049589 TaxID=3154731 RepID=UPI0034238A8D